MDCNSLSNSKLDFISTTFMTFFYLIHRKNTPLLFFRNFQSLYIMFDRKGNSSICQTAHGTKTNNILCIMPQLSFGDTEINMLSLCWVKFWLLLVQAKDTLSSLIYTRSCSLASKLHFNFATKVEHRVLLMVMPQTLPSLLTCSLDTRHWNFLPPNST